MYEIRYSQIVIKKDIKALSNSVSRQIKGAIEAKLMTNPIEFGKPLRYSLKAMRRLRVGNYRVVYRIEKNIVFIEAIAHRKDVYDK